MKERIQQARATLKSLLKQYEAATEQLAELRAQWHQLGPMLTEAPSPLHSEEEPLDPGDSEASESLLGGEGQDALMSAHHTGGEITPRTRCPFVQVKRRRRLTQAPFPHGTTHPMSGTPASQASSLA